MLRAEADFLAGHAGPSKEQIWIAARIGKKTSKPPRMHLLQVALQQRRRPARGVVAIVARVGLDDGLDKRINDPQGGRRPTAAGGVEQRAGGSKSVRSWKA